MNTVDERKREAYIRLNTVLPSNEPAIDNIDIASLLAISATTAKLMDVQRMDIGRLTSTPLLLVGVRLRGSIRLARMPIDLKTTV